MTTPLRDPAALADEPSCPLCSMTDFLPWRDPDNPLAIQVVCQGCGMRGPFAETDAESLKRLMCCRAPLSSSGDEWLDIGSAPKNRKIIAGYWNPLGNWRTITAQYYAEGTLDSYDDATESGFAAEGWYEESETHEELMPCDMKPTHWRPLPTPPSSRKTTPTDGGEG